jgi:glucose-1-phosphate cytidylyltransferase
MTKVVILCGGKGTRLREETEYKPKPLVEIGGRPIVWHIMKHYASYGFRDFVLCLGYKGDMIKQYFLNYKTQMNDFTLSLKDGAVHVHGGDEEDWNITCVDTGQEALTGERLLRIAHFIGDDPHFMVTYGDGVGDVNIKELFAYHKRHGNMGTLTGIKPLSKYGALRVDEQNAINTFVEKPQLNDRINGGFIVFNREIFQHLNNEMFEKTTLPTLAADGQLRMFLHDGFWHCMDTYRDYLHLNKLWQESSPWRTWHDHDTNTTLGAFPTTENTSEGNLGLEKQKEERANKVLIIGASGFIGTLLHKEFSRDMDVVGTYNQHPQDGLLQLDMTDRDAVHRLLDEVRPEVVIQPAAQPWVDFCEENPDVSHAVNVKGAQHVIDWCAEHHVYYLFISTDYVFDGQAGPYLEDAMTEPLNVYGKHKLDVERYISEKLPTLGCVVRTVGVYGWEKHGKNFVARLVRTLREGKEITVPSDQIATPIHAADLATAIRVVVEKRKAGIYHAAGPTNLSRYDFSLIIAEVFGCNTSLISSVPTSELGQAARRPLRAGLVNRKMQEEFGVVFRDPRSALTQMKEQGNPYD